MLSSPLLRARETATPIAEAAGVTLEVDHRLAPGAGVDELREVAAAQGERWSWSATSPTAARSSSR